MNLISVDPGLRACGVGVYAAGVLVAAKLVTSPNERDRGGACWADMAWAVAAYVAPFAWDVGVVEFPQQYDGAGHTADRSDVSELAAVAGAVAVILSVRGARLWTPTPREWKGQTPKEVHNRRVLATLTAAEVGRIEWPRGERGRVLKTAHNVTDGIGLGLRFLRRI